MEAEAHLADDVILNTKCIDVNDAHKRAMFPSWIITTELKFSYITSLTMENLHSSQPISQKQQHKNVGVAFCKMWTCECAQMYFKAIILLTSYGFC